MPQKGYVWDKESVQKRADSNRGKKRSFESRQRMRDAQLKYNATHDITSHKREMALKQWDDPNARELARQRAIKQMSDIKNREHLRNLNLGKKASEETKRKMSETHSVLQKNPIMRQRQSDAHKGEKSYLWKGGITPLVLDIRHCHRMRIWRDSIFVRDNYQCSECKKKKTYLNAHHIISFSSLIEKYNIKSVEEAERCNELWDISNGITLCKKCHSKQHKATTEYK